MAFYEDSEYQYNMRNGSSHKMVTGTCSTPKDTCTHTAGDVLQVVGDSQHAKYFFWKLRVDV